MQGLVVLFTSFALVGVCKADETNTGDGSGAGSDAGPGGASSGAGSGGASSGAGSDGAWSGAGPGGAWSGAGPGGATSGAGSWAGSGAGPGGAWAGPGGAWAGPGGAWAGPGGAWAGPGGAWAGPSGAWAGPRGAWAGQRFPQHYGPDFSDPNWIQNFQFPSGPGSVQTVVVSGNGYTSCNGLECPQGSSCGSSSVNGATNTICSDNNGNIVAQRVTDRQGNEVDPSKITRVKGFASCATFRCPPNTNCGSSNANGVTTILCADRDGNIVAP